MKSNLVILLFTLFIPSSPRWLLSKDRETDAVAALRRLRPKEDTTTHCEEEIIAIKEALQEDVHKGPWLDLVRGSNLRRTTIVMVFYFFQQVCEISISGIRGLLPSSSDIVSSFAGYWSSFHIYLSNDILQAEWLCFRGVHISCHQRLSKLHLCYSSDDYGRSDRVNPQSRTVDVTASLTRLLSRRRFAIMLSFVLQAFWMYMLAGLGEKSGRTPSERNAIVASFMLFSFSYNVGVHFHLSPLLNELTVPFTYADGPCFYSLRYWWRDS